MAFKSLTAPLNDASEIPQLPTSPTPDEVAAMERFRADLVLMHRHEDMLLNSRLQGFVVGTSLLVAAFTQFREPRYLLGALIVCSVGIALSLATEHMLRRTSKAIEWYIIVLRNIERALIPYPNMRPYDTRRILTKRHHIGVSVILGRGLPLGTLLLWVLLSVFACITGFVPANSISNGLP